MSTWKPTMQWVTPPHGPRSRVLHLPTGGKWSVRPSGPNSNRYVAYLDDIRTEITGVGLHYVMARVESMVRAVVPPAGGVVAPGPVQRATEAPSPGQRATMQAHDMLRAQGTAAGAAAVLLGAAGALLDASPPADRGAGLNAALRDCGLSERAMNACSAFVDVFYSDDATVYDVEEKGT